MPEVVEKKLSAFSSLKHAALGSLEPMAVSAQADSPVNESFADGLPCDPQLVIPDPIRGETLLKFGGNPADEVFGNFTKDFTPSMAGKSAVAERDFFFRGHSHEVPSIF